MNVLIIDDEPKARSLLSTLINENCHFINEVYTAENLIDGVSIIKTNQPDIVFLDIEMPKHSGLEILDFIPESERNFEIIFVTAYSDYAIKAFKLSAIDYLLKPINTQDLTDAINRASKQLNKKNNQANLSLLRENLEINKIKKIALPVGNTMKFINIEDIIFLKADAMYTFFYVDKIGKILVSKPLKHFTELLKNRAYLYRPHRSYLVNLNHIIEYSKQDGGYLLMSNNETVLITKEKKSELFNLLNL